MITTYKLAQSTDVSSSLFQMYVALAQISNDSHLEQNRKHNDSETSLGERTYVVSPMGECRNSKCVYVGVVGDMT